MAPCVILTQHMRCWGVDMQHACVLHLKKSGLCASAPLQDFSSVAEKTGTYTAFDYADIMEHLTKRWKLAERSDLTGEVRHG